MVQRSGEYPLQSQMVLDKCTVSTRRGITIREKKQETVEGAITARKGKVVLLKGGGERNWKQVLKKALEESINSGLRKSDHIQKDKGRRKTQFNWGQN